ncbi:uncharacterized protein PpBr36_05710 [Pyricularia pennisetigena]|uniref:uncharacterized protein n=1 Tax=Pyricularia pennisetigena TaxID=1578925 RepID=UPI00114F6032|nr:uncharacterized protein PpBr36_05710 [Pyricularia pennisetigena]TLS23522.1 hypothetical protein PpBr36_05710 [Pyricularia pennisetigena]
MSSFTFAPPQAFQPQQKNYVFVDEHNRHKRLKVMRACEGCRRRKIKCDAATSAQFPCSACRRLKLHCVRPNGFDGTSADGQSCETMAGDYEDSPPQQPRNVQQDIQHILTTPGALKPPPATSYVPQTAYSDASPGSIYNPSRYPDSQSPHGALSYSTLNTPITAMESAFGSHDMFPNPPAHRPSIPHSPPESYSSGDHGSDLADLLGPLKLNEFGTAPYLNNKMRPKQAEEEPVVGEEDDYKSSLPPLPSGPGLKIRIPPELMPDDDTALHYFDLYFTQVHPYVPVLDKAMFLDQWHNNRESLSPLILEAVFTVAGRLADEPGEGQQWLALATRHLDSFMDVPRLSTLQALLIVIKAREASPKRGYYFRSWMSIVQCVQMGKDLSLDDHYQDHLAGKSCGSGPAECLMKTRIWQTIFIMELMIGSPQGRYDLAVQEDTVDLRIPRPTPGVDDSEYHVSRNITYMSRIVCNVARANRSYGRVRRKINRDWALEPEVVQLTSLSHAWLNELPSDLAVNFPPDGSPPWLTSAFIGNMHSYYYLSIIMLHRPQLQLLDPNGADGQWKHHMVVCYSSAKLLCRLEEAIIRSYGIAGLQSMQRGINYTIYCVLTCIILHLVAITSPDPDLNTDAREYFTRHMRILERCMAAWPMPEMQKQIDAVREAFSADMRKPFVLKPSFPYASPAITHSTPPRSAASRVGPMDQLSQQSLRLPGQSSQVSYASLPISPPTSAGPGDGTGNSSPTAQALSYMSGTPGSQATSAALQQQQTMSMADPSVTAWNPTRLFDQWNSTFGTPQPQPISTSMSARTPSLNNALVSPVSTGASEVPTLQDIQAAQSTMTAANMHQHAAAAQSYAAQAPVPNFVTPAMWQESVASVYEGGIKRGWDYEATGMDIKPHRT